ncbi:MAG: imidazole glycerol phosphate synthase subunit HisF [Candidatus Magasanikbacteria bacterium]|nr:imidazole glycerol phosphate synthase subunit HisF [Candidatus Magasanikbacteria bacterium]
MLKVRVIPTLLFKNFGLVKGVRFDSWRRTGSAMQTIKVYNLREVDELLFLDISATGERRPPDFAMIDEIADECFVPLGVGGGVATIEDARRLLLVGADKIVVNTAAVQTPELVSAIAGQFGSQCAVVSIDAKQKPDGSYEVYTHSGTQPTGLEVAAFAKKMATCGAGEIILTSIDRDGTMDGYDILLIKSVASAVGIPVIASGGAGSYEHMAEAILAGGASAVSAASIFHFTEATPLEAKRYLKERGIAVRL